MSMYEHTVYKNVSVCPNCRSVFSNRPGIFGNCRKCGTTLLPLGIPSETWNELTKTDQRKTIDEFFNRIESVYRTEGTSPEPGSPPEAATNNEEKRKAAALSELRSISDDIHSIAGDHHYMRSVLQTIVTLLLIAIFAPIVIIVIMFIIGINLP